MQWNRASAPGLAVAFALCFSASAACGADRDLVRGPVEVRVEKVLDGDTFVGVAHVWPGHSVRVSVRIRGIDAPELKSRCAAERGAAETARRALEQLLAEAPVEISNIGGGKYYGRVLADVSVGDGRPAARVLLERGLARPYRGGKRGGWCG